MRGGADGLFAIGDARLGAALGLVTGDDATGVLEGESVLQLVNTTEIAKTQ
ncbi:MAG: hypothetical protein LH660_14225 [Phormidesmis sp. CAN_BIN36]|nr:hypothetical protein [Phormidesmis sp. CAN_BIN36]